MLVADEDALICDFAEYYHITDMRALPVTLLATLASGLRDNSRIRMKLSKSKITLDQLLHAAEVDRLGRIFWVLSGNARAKKDPPESILDIIQGKERAKENTSGLRTFETPDDFQRAWKELTGNNNGN